MSIFGVIIISPRFADEKPISFRTTAGDNDNVSPTRDPGGQPDMVIEPIPFCEVPIKNIW
jgi:hypothetical protein